LSRTASQRSNVARARQHFTAQPHPIAPAVAPLRLVHLIIAGLFTRAAAFVLAVLYCFTFLFMAAAGGGRWSLDALIDRGRRSRPPTVEAEPQPTRRWAA